MSSQFSTSTRPPKHFHPPNVCFTDSFLDAGFLFDNDAVAKIYFSYVDSGGSVTLPMLQRSITGSNFTDLTSPYGYGGPVIVGEPNTTEFLSRWTDWAQDNGVVSAFVRFDPVSGNHASFPQFAQYASPTVLIPCGRDVDIVQNLSKRVRKNYRRGERLGLETEVSTSVTTDDLVGFRTTYESTMNRLDAQEIYYPRTQWWRHISASTSELGVVLTTTRLEGRIQAQGLRLKYRETAYAFLSCTTDEGRTNNSAEYDKICFLLWCQNEGIEIVNFGGGLGGRQDTLLEHKRRFAPNAPVAPFYVGKLVFLPSAYQQLSGAAADDSTFFPSYRSLTNKP